MLSGSPVPVPSLASEKELYWKNRWYWTVKTVLNCTEPVIGGWLHSQEAALLMSYAAVLPAKSTVVELGSFMGKSSRHLVAGATYSESKLYCVDLFGEDSATKGLPAQYQANMRKAYGASTLAAFLHNMHTITGFDDLPFEVIQTSSKQAAKNWKGEQIDLLFIDANHKECRQDYDHWEEHLEEHATIALHDVHFTGDYGEDSPSNTYMYLLQKGYRITNAEITTAFFTRDPHWWQTRFEAAADNLNIDTTDWFAGGRRGAPTFNGSSSTKHSHDNGTERMASTRCKPNITEVNP